MISTTQHPKLLIESNWKKFARVGTSEKDEMNFTDCKTGKPVGLQGLSIIKGIVYVSDPKQISKIADSSICLGPGSPVQLDNKGRYSCNNNRWCAEYETEEACEGACHAVTGEGAFCLETYLILILGESCHWKSGNTSFSPTIGFSYSTCTPSISSCNDGVCDALERMDNSICPQDCVEKGE